MTQAYDRAMEAVSASAELLTERVIPPPMATPGWRAFCEAAGALAEVDPDDDRGRDLAVACADALVSMAARDEADNLAHILRPDPAAVRVTWTVACYQIGDLTPSALRDYPAAPEAVTAAATCEDSSHVAAELLASTEAGLRWSALVRTGERLAFQLLPKGMSEHDDGPIDEVAARWRAQLPEWAQMRDAPSAKPSSGKDAPASATEATRGEGTHFLAEARPPAESSFDLGFALGQLMATVRTLEASLADAELERERTSRRLEMLEAGAAQRIAELEGRLAELEATYDVALAAPPPPPPVMTAAPPPAPAPGSGSREAGAVLWAALRSEASAALTGLAQRLARRAGR